MIIQRGRYLEYIYQKREFYPECIFKTTTNQFFKNRPSRNKNGQNLSKQITKEDIQKWPISILKNAQLYQSSENYN